MNRHHPRILPAALLSALFALSLQTATATAEERHERGGPAHVEMQREPRGYARVERPHAIDTRPQALDRDYFGHNFQANRTYRIGPYHAPPGFVYRRWAFGEFLPAPFWGVDFVLADFWLFGLDIPPVGYEWVRYGPDAVLVHIGDGEIGQVVYSVFR